MVPIPYPTVTKEGCHMLSGPRVRRWKRDWGHVVGVIENRPAPAGQYHVRFGNSTDSAVAISASVNYLR